MSDEPTAILSQSQSSLCHLIQTAIDLSVGGDSSSFCMQKTTSIMDSSGILLLETPRCHLRRVLIMVADMKPVDGEVFLINFCIEIGEVLIFE